MSCVDMERASSMVLSVKSKCCSARRPSRRTCTTLLSMRSGAVGSTDMDAQHTDLTPPLWLLAELTYRCPLHCAFCYNPIDFAKHGGELDAVAWRGVLDQARELGAVQIGFSGGEPLLR